MFCGLGFRVEREVIGERIRDKVAASKRKGIWMGGTSPIGYDVCGAATFKPRIALTSPQALRELFLVEVLQL